MRLFSDMKLLRFCLALFPRHRLYVRLHLTTAVRPCADHAHVGNCAGHAVSGRGNIFVKVGSVGAAKQPGLIRSLRGPRRRNLFPQMDENARSLLGFAAWHSG